MTRQIAVFVIMGGIGAGCVAPGADDGGVVEEQRALGVSRAAATALGQKVGVTSPVAATLDAAAFSVAQQSIALTAHRYFVYDVGRLDDVQVGPIRLNQGGAVSWNASGRAHVYKNGSSIDLGDLGGGQSVANDIIGDGTVVGKSMGTDGRWRAFSYANGVMTDLGGDSAKDVWEEAIATNYWGDVVGVESALGTLGRTAMRYQDGVAVPLADVVLPGIGLTPVTDIVDMNDGGDIVGCFRQAAGSLCTPLLSTNSGHLWTNIQGVPGLEFATDPRAINGLGHVVGVAGDGDPVHAFISRDPTLPATDLGTLDAAGLGITVADGINNYDRVVGWAGGPDLPRAHAFLYDGTQMIDLNTDLWNPVGWELSVATTINDAGQIAGAGTMNGALHAFLLQPMTWVQSVLASGIVAGETGVLAGPSTASQGSGFITVAIPGTTRTP
jgi:probable HAF family extracellular repeat protein